MARGVLRSTLALALAGLVSPALAQSAAPPAAELRAVPGGVLFVTLESDGALDAAAVRAAIGAELGVRVEDGAAATESAPRLELRVTQQGRQLDARYTADDRAIERSIRLPEDPQTALETTALLAGNLVRNEAEELLAELERQRRASATPAAPPPKPEPEPAPAKPPAKAEPAAEVRPPDAPLPFNLSLFHPVSLNRESERYTFALELGLVYARLGRVEGAAIDLFVNRIDHGLQGAALSTIWSHVDGRVEGAVLSAVGASGKGTFEGAQLTSVVALHRGRFSGMQGSLVALSWGELEGLQLALINAAGRLDGAQLGLVNVAARADGAEIGLINTAEASHGAQIGLVNVAERAHGIQVGLVNVAREADGEQIGLVSIGSRIRPTSWADIDADADVTLHAGLKFQSRTFYSLFGFGVSPDAAADHRFASTAALGVRLPVAPVFWQLDGGLIGLHGRDFSGDSPGVMRYRGMLGLDVAPWLSVFAGGGIEHQILPDTSGPRGLGLAGIELL